MQLWKIRFQWYSDRAETKSEAIAKAVKLIQADVPSFVLDAEPPDPAPKNLAQVAKAVVTGKP